MKKLEEHIRLSQLTTLIGDAITVHLSPSYWIVADVVELRENYSGHCYLNLAEKDEDKVLAQCRASIWKPTYRMLKPYFESTTGQAFTSGVRVKIKVAVSFHNVYGLNLTVQDIDPTFTVGELTVRRQQILQMLENDGVVDMNKALELPVAPQRIAVISSPTAAGYEDFIEQLKQNPYDYAFDAKLFPAVMQGDGAEASLVSAMEQVFDRIDEFDVVVIIRGGGSALDLACFDNYNIAFYLTQMPVPVIVGIGHERDETVLDLIAHTALKTPTAVAAYLVDLLQNVERQVDEISERLQMSVHQIVLRQKQNLYNMTSGLPALLAQDLASKKMLLQNTVFRLSESIKEYLDSEKNTVNPFTSRLQLGLNDSLHRHHKRLDRAELVSVMADPKLLLRKGYSITIKDGKVVKSLAELKKGDVLTTHLDDGKVDSILS